MEKEIIEKNILIAKRIPKSDRWYFIKDSPEGKINNTLTDTLEAFFNKTKYNGDFRISPLKSELYIISSEEKEINITPYEKKYSLYGDFGE